MADLEVRQSNITMAPVTVTGSATAASTPAVIKIVDPNVIESSNDCANFSSSSNEGQGSENASEKELDNALRPLFTKYGANWNQIKNEAWKLFGKINHQCSNTITREITIKPENIQKITTYLEQLLKTLKENNLEITLENLLAVHDNVVITKTKDLFNKEDAVTLEEIKQAGLIGELAFIAGCTVPELEKKSEAEINKIITIWKNTYKELSESNEPISAKTLREKANNNVLLDKVNVTPQELEEMIARGDVKSLRNLLGLEDGEEITAEKIAQFLTEQNETFKAQLEQITDPQERADFIKSSVAEQKKLFTLTLCATDRSDRKQMLHAIKDFFAENRGETFKILLTSLDEETRIELASSIDDKKLKEILLNPDVLNNYVSKEDATGIAIDITTNSTASAIQNRHNAMMNDEDLLRIKAKLESGEELTEEEQRLYDYFVARQAGEEIGTANHNYYDPQSNEIQALLEQMNRDAYSLPTYRDVMSTISKYIEEHPEVLKMSAEDFTKLMDEVTGGNYSTVVSDIENGTTSELTPPAQSSGYIPAPDSDSNAGSYSPDLGFITREPVDTTKVDKLKADVLTPPAAAESPILTPESAPADILAASQDSKSFKAFLKSNGAVNTVTEVFSNITHITNQGVINRATLLYKGLKQMQDDVLMAVNNSGLTALLPHTADSTLRGLEGQTFANFDATRQVREACEELEEA